MEEIAEQSLANQSSKSLSETDLPFSIELELKVKDRDTIAELCRFSEGDPREEFALIALRIGVLALRQARGQLDADLIRRETERLLGGLEQYLDKHAHKVELQLTSTLKEYFDPTTGKFHERVERLVKRDGDLEKLLRAQIGNDDSELCKTLAEHIGLESPLMKKLDPQQKDGVLATLSEIVAEKLKLQAEQILGEFSLDNEDGALFRLIGQLTEKHDKLGKNLKDKIDEVIKELSLDDEGSFFSRLQQSLDKTSKTIDKNLTLDDENSSLARLQRHVSKILDQQGEANQKFQEEVKTALNSLVVRRQESQRSTTHGVEFQEVVGEFLMPYVQRRGDIIEFTGDRVGRIKSCKKGDFVIELGQESAAPGAKVVVEAKEEKKYTLGDARKEIEVARGNRDAQAGLFVFSSVTAPSGLDIFSRLGNDVFVVWDRENPLTDIYLQVGFDLAKALCLRAAMKDSAQSEDIGAIDAVILDIEKSAKSLEEVATWAETIQSNAGKIIDRSKKARQDIVRQVQNLQVRLNDLKSSMSMT